MNLRTLARTALAAFLFSAIPYASVTAVASITATPAALAQNLAHLKTKGAAEIDRRVANLTAARAKLKDSTRLTASDKNALLAQIDAELTNLDTLKTKLAADTTLAGARTNVARIVADYRVYALMLPKARLVASADRFAIVDARLTDVAVKLQVKIDAAKAAGKDVTTAQASLDDLKLKTASAKAKTNGTTAQLLAIAPADYNANHTILMSYRATLKAAHDDVKTARTDAKAVVEALKAIK